MVIGFAQIAERRMQTLARNKQGNHRNMVSIHHKVKFKRRHQMAMGNIKVMGSRMVMSRNNIDNIHHIHREKMMSGKNLR